MPAFPYREPVQVEPDPPPEPAPEAIRLGSRSSVHAPPPLRAALLGPVLIAALIVGVGFALDLSGGNVTTFVLPLAALILLILAWSPLRLRGHVVTLHAQGVVLTRPGSRAVVTFDDVNEVWFETSLLHSKQGAYLRALRLVDFAGASHRVPLEVNDGAALANSVLRCCSLPLLVEARRALADGEALTFRQVRLDRDGITIQGASAAWRDIRLARVQPARVAFFRRLPLWPWRTVQLDRIPNPAVFSALVADHVKRVKRDDLLMTPLSAPPRSSGPISADAALRSMLFGGLVCLAGIGVTWFTYADHHDSYVIAFGPIIFGAVRFFQGLAALGSGPPR